MRACIRSVAGFVGALFISTAGWAATPDDSTAPAQSSAEQRSVLEDAVRVALRCELEGNDIDRNALLLHVLEQDPEFAPARWHLGYLSTGDKWVSHQDSLSIATGRSDRLSWYREFRESVDDSIADHLLIANAAREREMWDEERAHLRRIVELDWDNAEARQRLGDVRVDGSWVTREEFANFTLRLMQTRVDLDEWKTVVDRIVRRLANTRQTAWEMAWSDFASIRDPAAIPAVEAALSERGERAAEWYLEWLRGLDAWEASAALTRQAILAPSANIRTQAQLALRNRRIDDYAPILLGAIRANPVAVHDVSWTRFGGLLYVRHVAFETQSEVRQRRLAVLYGPERLINFDWAERSRLSIDGALRLNHLHNPILVGKFDKVMDNTPRMDPVLRASALEHLHRHYGVASVSGGDVAGRIQVINDRLMRTLAAATGIRHAHDPQEWWDWWNGYQQVFVEGDKPIREEAYEEYWTAEWSGARRRREPDRIAVRIESCFAPDTPVVTEHGPKPIEEIALGDRVLAQDIDTGQIAFKPVFKTTTRPPVELLKITTEDGELVCTAGHPFWINGLGWRYAWELEPGMRFHAVDGSCEIISIEDSGRTEEAYNLVVADYHNYFVGEGRILSHDNSPRNPTNALVPGLMPDWSAAVAENEQDGQTP